MTTPQDIYDQLNDLVQKTVDMREKYKLLQSDLAVNPKQTVDAVITLLKVGTEQFINDWTAVQQGLQDVNFI